MSRCWQAEDAGFLETCHTSSKPRAHHSAFKRTAYLFNCSASVRITYHQPCLQTGKLRTKNSIARGAVELCTKICLPLKPAHLAPTPKVSTTFRRMSQFRPGDLLSHWEVRLAERTGSGVLYAADQPCQPEPDCSLVRLSFLKCQMHKIIGQTFWL